MNKKKFYGGKMSFLNKKLKKLSIISLLISINLSGTTINIQQIPAEVNTSISQKTVGSILCNLEKIIENTDQIKSEINSINPITAKNTLIVGLLKCFNGEISILDIQKLSLLETCFIKKLNDQEIIQTIANILIFFIEKVKTQTYINLQNKEKLSILEKKIYEKINNPKQNETSITITKILENPTIQKMLDPKSQDKLLDFAELFLIKNFKDNALTRKTGLNTIYTLRQNPIQIAN